MKKFFHLLLKRATIQEREGALKMREWKTWHYNTRAKNSGCDIDHIVLPEKHVDIIGFKPESAVFGKNVGPHINFPTLAYKNLPQIQRYNCTHFCFVLICDMAFWIRKSYSIHVPEIVVLHQMNVATRHKDFLTGQKMSRCCPTFSGLWAPFLWGPWFGRTLWTCLNPLLRKRHFSLLTDTVKFEYTLL